MNMICDDVPDSVMAISSESGLLDSGSSVVILKPESADLFSSLSHVSKSISTAANHGELNVCAERSIGNLLNGVLLADNLRENMVSASQLADLGYEVLFGRREVIVLSGRVIAIGQRIIGGHYIVFL